MLISDGVETCNADPCALSAQLAKQGVKFTAHVVGFDLEDERIALARQDQPDFSWLSAQSAGEVKSMDLKMPDAVGLYEVRFLDVAGRRLLGRSLVEVK